MTPTQQKNAQYQLNYVKANLDTLVAESCADEDFMPELAGMAERVGVILSAVKAGYYTQELIAKPVPEGFNGGIRLTAETTAMNNYTNPPTPYSYKIVGTWACCECQENLKAGDIVNCLTANLKHIDCDRPQG